ncbi:hypothetical protein NRF20_04295 [Streptomyces sp. R-74717]
MRATSAGARRAAITVPFGTVVALRSGTSIRPGLMIEFIGRQSRRRLGR